MSTTREGWLQAAAKELAGLIEAVGEEVPDIHVSVGWPGGRSNRERTIGQCWTRASSADEVNQIFISPIRGEAETRDVLGTLLHEMIHAVDDCESGHRGNFARIAKAVGFVPKLTQSGNRSEDLDVALDEVAEIVGPFPHAALDTGAGGGSEVPKKQASRMIKVICGECGYTLRTTQKWIDIGLPTCVCGEEMGTA